MVMKMIQSFLLNTLEILLCIYAVLQHIFRKSRVVIYMLEHSGVNIILASVCALLSIFTLVLLVILLLPLAIYKEIVNIILKNRYKEDYGGLLEGIDEMWALETKEARHIINCLLFINFTETEENIMGIVKKIYTEKILYQFTSIRKRFSGYYYRLKNQANTSDLLKEMKLSEEERTNKQLFEKVLGKYANAPMPKNDSASFEIFVSTKPVQFSSNEEGTDKKLYPLLMRIHHTVGDGTALLSFLLKNLADEQISVEEEIMAKVKSFKKFIDCENAIKNFEYNVIEDVAKEVHKYGEAVYNKLKQIANVNVYHFPPMAEEDCNILHGSKLCGEKVLSYYIEEQPNYILKIKSIKKRIPGSTFSDVLMTAVSASFWKYYKEYSEDIPEQIYLSFVIKPIEKNLEYIVSEKTGQKEIKLGNKFSLGLLRLPIKINIQDQSTALRERLMMVKEESEKLRNALDILVNYWQLRFFANLLPAPLMNLLIGMNQVSTATVSNLPGIRAIHIQNYKLQDVLFWIPNVANLGLGLSILTYDGRFQMGLVADKSLISNNEKAQNILRNIVKYIDLLDDELSKDGISSDVN